MSAEAAVEERLGDLVGELLVLVDGFVPASVRLDLEEAGGGWRRSGSTWSC